MLPNDVTMLGCMSPGVPGPRVQEQAITGLFQAAGLRPLVRWRCWRDRLPALFAREGPASLFASCPSLCPSTNQSTNQSNKQPINQSINQSICLLSWGATDDKFSAVNSYSQGTPPAPLALVQQPACNCYILASHPLAILSSFLRLFVLVSIFVSSYSSSFALLLQWMQSLSWKTRVSLLTTP